MTKTVSKVYKYIKSVLIDDNAHGLEHVERVRNWAVKIAKSEKYKDLELVEIVSLLHDIGFSKTNKWSEHAELGSKMAMGFLRKNNLLSSEKIAHIGTAIINHSVSLKNQDQLVCIIRDADMLDMVGAIGIIRTLISQNMRSVYDKNNIKGVLWKSDYKKAYDNYNSEIGAGKTIIDQLNFQIHCLNEIKTKYARKEALIRCKYITNFILEFDREIKV